MDQSSDRSAAGRREEAVYAVAGLADVLLGQVGEALQRTGSVLRRGDRSGLLRDGYAELAARGRLALRRHTEPPEPYIESLARRAIARRGGGDA
ncbi:polyprenyl synthetase [Actinomadura fibrosa]|uniref:Polyprenyl synthetase n=1 Tax=Actinomadura fibrosa TaxID=111802 RepID=A0ABW2XI04_9ACTN|nr:polyprenyl synthetase [Actinomadura fibrosa]